MLKQLENWFIAPRCVLTGKPGSDLDLAPEIIAKWDVMNAVCPQCAEFSADNRLCGACISQPPAFDRTQAGFYFKDEIIDLIHALKYNNKVAYGRLLAELLAPKLVVKDVQAILAVPLHPSRLRERGFNQAELIAQSLSESLQIPLLSHAVQRTKATPTQTQLSAQARQKNLRNAFRIRRPEAFNGITSLAMVDDVMTTGATMQALASQIKGHTAVQDVQAWCVAKVEHT